MVPVQPLVPQSPTKGFPVSGSPSSDGSAPPSGRGSGIAGLTGEDGAQRPRATPGQVPQHCGQFPPAAVGDRESVCSAVIKKN